MNRIVSASLVGAVLATATLFAPAASAGNVAWSVAIGGPGFAIGAGQPGFVGGAYWGGGYRAGPGVHGWNRPWNGPVASAPIIVMQPVFAPVAGPFPVVAPVVVRSRRVFVPAPVFRPRPVVYGAFWPR
jgi:uncharacterized membrane protein